MTPFARFLRKVAQKVRGTFYEGPEPPARLAHLVKAFAGSRRRATRGQWIAFAKNLAEEAYRSGWTRGYEWAEREEQDPADPDFIAEHEAHGWEWADEGEIPEPEGLDEAVPDAFDPNAILLEEMEEAER